jgi:hypothetical protein
MPFNSEIRELSRVAFPDFTGLRIMMMPFHLKDLTSVPYEYADYVTPLIQLRRHVEDTRGTWYLTVDEAIVEPGKTHRRPGLHIDGAGHWAPNPGPWGGKGGMLVAASVLGSEAWRGTVDGELGEDGCCEHLRHLLPTLEHVPLQGTMGYWLGPTALHDSIVMTEFTPRQFLRVSYPSEAPWYEGYTENRLGVLPTGPIHPPRKDQMGFRK